MMSFEMKMDLHQTSVGSGCSPEISAELLLHGQRIAVASIGPDAIVVWGVQRVERGQGTIRLDMDGRITLYHVDLVNGIDPDRDRQTFLLLRTTEEAAA